MPTKPEFIVAAFMGGTEATIPQVAEIFGCTAQNKLATALAVAAELDDVGLTLRPSIESGDFDDVRVVVRSSEPAEDLHAQIFAIESSQLEFKSTLLFNINQAERQPDLAPDQLRWEPILQATLKTICGFLNKDGGTLFIGVNDDQSICGVERDFLCLRGRQDIDQWERYLLEQIAACFFEGRDIIHYIETRILNVDGHFVARVDVTRRSEVSFFKAPGESVFRCFVRSGNRTIELRIEDMPPFIRRRMSG